MNPLDAFAPLAGTWQGKNVLHDPETGRPDETPSTLTVTPVLGGRFVRLDYSWSYRDAPQEGSMLLGFDPKSGEASAHWVDTWHMGRKVLACVGGVSENGGLTVRGSFAAPPGPDWGWRIEVAPVGATLAVRHTVIEPGGEESAAVEGVYSRAGRATFRAVGPFGDTDTDALPVRHVGPAVAFYTRVLGFRTVSADETSAVLERDAVRIGLAENGLDPEQAGCWFAVDDVDALRRELDAAGVAPGPVLDQEHGGRPHRVVFAREPYGVCFCFTQPKEGGEAETP